ncbi:MAG: hypothetical protein AAF495_24935 [Pseudomonadota bacterium]
MLRNGHANARIFFRLVASKLFSISHGSPNKGELRLRAARRFGVVPAFDGRGQPPLAMEENLTKPERGAVAPMRGSRNNTKDERQRKHAEAIARRARFAKALAQAEFGRFYWDDRLAADLDRSMRRPRPPKEARKVPG